MRAPNLILRIVAILLPLFMAGCNVTDSLNGVANGPGYGKGYITGTTPKRGYGGNSRVSGAATGSGLHRRALREAEYYIADDNRLAKPIADGQPLSIGADGGVTLNFVNAQLSEVVDIVLGDILMQNYSLSPAIQGTVNARTNIAIPKTDVLPVLENLLALNGASLVKSGGIWHVLPFDETRNLPNVVVGPNRKVMSGGQGVHFIRLAHAPVSSVIGIVSGQANPGRQITADPDRNLIIFVGPVQEARAIEQMVAVLDIDLLRNKSFALIPIKVATVGDIVENLNEAFDTASIRSVKFVGIERMSAILAISRNADHLRMAEQWVTRLDRADSRGNRQVFVYYVRNGRATELAQIVSGLFEENAKASGGRAVAPGLEPVKLTQEQLEAPNGAAAAAAARTGRLPALYRPPTIVADERNNALVIKSTADDYSDIEAILSRLDIVPLQVLIEVIVAEVSLDGELEFGVEWYLKSGSFSGIFSTLSSGAVENSFPGFGFSFETSDAKVVLNALDAVTDVDVISSPKLMVLDNQSARLQVGDQVPVATRTAVSTDTDTAPIVNTVELVDTGVILEVTPTVNTGGMVSLNVAQEVSEATTTVTSDIDSPTIQTRKIQSTLAVQSGETVALAGMMRERLESGETGVPGLNRMPVIGGLFRSRTKKNARTELIVLITPHVVRDPNEMRQLTKDLKDSLSAVSKF